MSLSMRRLTTGGRGTLPLLQTSASCACALCHAQGAMAAASRHCERRERRMWLGMPVDVLLSDAAGKKDGSWESEPVIRSAAGRAGGHDATHAPPAGSVT